MMAVRYLKRPEPIYTSILRQTKYGCGEDWNCVGGTTRATSVTEISYGQDVHRRVGAAIGLAVVAFGLGALMALSKSKKHFVGITWANGDKKGGLVMQCDKNDYRGVLPRLE